MSGKRFKFQTNQILQKLLTMYMSREIKTMFLRLIEEGNRINTFDFMFKGLT